MHDIDTKYMLDDNHVFNTQQQHGGIMMVSNSGAAVVETVYLGTTTAHAHSKNRGGGRRVHRATVREVQCKGRDSSGCTTKGA